MSKVAPAEDTSVAVDEGIDGIPSSSAPKFRWKCLWLLIMLMCLSVYLMYTVLKPYLRQLHKIPGGFPSIDSFSVSMAENNDNYRNMTSTTSHWNISIFVSNPYESCNISYQEVDVQVFYMGVPLGGDFVKPFHSLQFNEAKLVTASQTIVVDNYPLLAKVGAERSLKQGVVYFNVQIHAKNYVFSSSVKKMNTCYRNKLEMWLHCGELKVVFSSSNATTASMLPGGTGKCESYWEEWW